MIAALIAAVGGYTAIALADVAVRAEVDALEAKIVSGEIVVATDMK